jgi:O-antigen/teichoic acid export membrane protein
MTETPSTEAPRAAAACAGRPNGDGAAAAQAREALRAAAAHGVRWSAVTRPVVEVVQFGSIVVLARLIVPAEFGRYAIALIGQEVAYLIVAGGLSSALVQRKTVGREHLESGMAIGLIAGGALAALTVLAASTIVAPVFGARTALFVGLMAPLCVISGASTVPMATLQRRLAFRRLSEIEVAGTVTRVAVSIGLALAGAGGAALVLGVVAGSTATGALAWISAPGPMPRYRGKAARELLRFGAPVSAASVSWVGFRNVDYAIIGARLGAVQTGLYFRAYTIAVEYQSKIAVVMGQVGFPVLARARDGEELKEFYREMVKLLTLAVFPLLTLLAITAPTAVPFLFGPRWGAAAVPVQILALGGASTVVINAVGTVLMASGRVRALVGYGTAHFVVYGLTVMLVVRYGIVAVAIDAAVVHTLFLAGAYGLMARGTRDKALRCLWEDVAPATVACAGLAAVTLPASIALTAAGAPAAVWLAAVGATAPAPYAATLRLCFPETWRKGRAALRRILPRSNRQSAARPRRAAGGTVGGPAGAGVAGPP